MSLARSSRRDVIGGFALVAVAAALVVIASVFHLDALGARRSVADIDAVRLASARVSAVDAVARAGGEPDTSMLLADLATLEADHAVLLDRLEPAEADHAAEMLESIASCGIMLADGGEPMADAHPHHHVDELLTRAADLAGAEADRAEWRAGVAMIAAMVAGLLMTALLIRSRFSEFQLRRALLRRADTDVLTGLSNRRVLRETLDRSPGHGVRRALLVLDLDGFKQINDVYGHEAGDEMLRKVAQRLSRVSRAQDVLVRLGGDEFAVVIEGVPEGSTAENIAARSLDALVEPIAVGGTVHRVRASIGLAGADTNRPDRMLVEADLAMYEAKRLGGGQVVRFHEGIEDSASRAATVIQALRTLDHEHDLELVVQPIVGATDGVAHSHEALVRWTDPTLGPVSPAEFIPLAERTGLIIDIGATVARRLCASLRAWDEAGDGGHRVSLNVSPVELRDVDFVDRLVSTIRSHGLATDRFTVEITESAVIEEPELVAERLRRLRAEGIRIAIDDFGSGYSNLAQLLSVPFDVLKVDRSLLLHLSGMREANGGDPSGPCNVMSAIVEIAGTFGAPVVCEGVETAEQLASLQRSGVTFVQGYLTGRPAPTPIRHSLAHEPTPA